MIVKTLACAVVLMSAPQDQPNSEPASTAAKASLASSSTAETTALELLPIEQNIVHYTNVQRAKYGLPALEVDESLMGTARKHASWMTRARNLVHTRLPVAENIAMGQRDSQEVVHAWMNSSGHRANILNRSHRHIGVAAYRTTSGTIYWCQQFRP